MTLPLEIRLEANALIDRLVAQAAGIGTAEMENDGRSIEVNVNGGQVWRLGGYKVTHRPGEMTIGLMMDVNPLTAEECFLVYRDRYKPLRLELKTQRSFTLPLWRFSFELSIPGRQIWKLPQA